ncbi:CPBP family intramembrane metalloprotease [bacterium]|nr:CPBP family intramembrane metalloprotease [bacterium]
MEAEDRPAPEPVVAAPPVLPGVCPPHPAAEPWGWLATLGFAAAIAGAFIILESLVVIGFMVVTVVRDPAFNLHTGGAALARNGLLWSLATLVSMPACSAMLIGIARSRRGLTWRDYLGLRPVGWRQLRLPLLLLALMLVSHDLLMNSLGRPIVPEIMVEVYRSSVVPSLLWLALVVVAPVCEELFWRGFLFIRVWRSRVGATGAILVTALCWAAIHVQYDWVGIVSVFGGGLLLGWARVRTGSVYPAILLHGLMNLLATIETWWLVS